MLRLLGGVELSHAEQVRRIASTLFGALENIHQLSDRYGRLLGVSALLYRIGVSINYYQYAKHSFYVISNARLDGLTHRETLLCAMIASFKSRSHAHKMFVQHRDILFETDVEIAAKLGTLLRVAIALDASETQAVASATAELSDKALELRLQTRHDPDLELKKAADPLKDFEKIWGVSVQIDVSVSPPPVFSGNVN